MAGGGGGEVGVVVVVGGRVRRRGERTAGHNQSKEEEEGVGGEAGWLGSRKQQPQTTDKCSSQLFIETERRDWTANEALVKYV